VVGYPRSLKVKLVLQESESSVLVQSKLYALRSLIVLFLYVQVHASHFQLGKVMQVVEFAFSVLLHSVIGDRRIRGRRKPNLAIPLQATGKPRRSTTR